MIAIFLGTIGIAFDGSMMDQMFSYIGDLFSDLNLPILLIVGTGVCLMVLGAIIAALSNRK